jgi:CRP-like cAMP-binding protein
MVSVEWLKETELFKGLQEDRLKALLLLSDIQSFGEGKTIFSQGGEASHLYVLIRGSVDLTVKAQEQVDFMTSKIEKEGAVFGTAALMEPYHYNVTATCLKPSEVLAIGAASLRKAMERDPAMGMEVMKKLATIYFNRLNELRSGVSNLLKIFKIKMS